MTLLKDKIKLYPMVKRNNCQDCGNPWWFDQGKQGFVCTTCLKTHGKSTSEDISAIDDAAEVTVEGN